MRAKVAWTGGLSLTEHQITEEVMSARATAGPCPPRSGHIRRFHPLRLRHRGCVASSMARTLVLMIWYGCSASVVEGLGNSDRFDRRHRPSLRPLQWPAPLGLILPRADRPSYIDTVTGNVKFPDGYAGVRRLGAGHRLGAAPLWTRSPDNE